MIPAQDRRALLGRALLYFGVWIVVDQEAKASHLAVGALAGAIAAWVSIRLLPTAKGRVRLWVLLFLLPRFLWQSLVAGLDVARRAFSLRPNLSTGFIQYRTQLPPGSARSAFELIASLMPGSVASDEDPDRIEFHCLDTGQPVQEQLATEERVYAPAFQERRHHG